MIEWLTGYIAGVEAKNPDITVRGIIDKNGLTISIRQRIHLATREYERKLSATEIANSKFEIVKYVIDSGVKAIRDAENSPVVTRDATRSSGRTK